MGACVVIALAHIKIKVLRLIHGTIVRVKAQQGTNFLCETNLLTNLEPPVMHQSVNTEIILQEPHFSLSLFSLQKCTSLGRLLLK